ncbi:MAG: hypothetical protein Q9227_000833 [Pyrenula ochraceoflavens]
MRQTLLRVFRTPVRKLLGHTSPLTSVRYGLTLRSNSLGFRDYSSSSQYILPGMHVKNFSVAAVSGLVAAGGWYTYKSQQHHPIKADAPPVSESTSLSSSQSFAKTTSSPEEYSVSSSPSASSSRRALVVDNDQFYTGEIVGDGPLSKDTDDYGRKVLEMMTPEDASARLRKSEESYLVNRGRGVVRYDTSSLPSNDPIEDDHAEKIIEVPNFSPEMNGDATSSDWMFWGVFDGHSGWTTSAKLRQVLISYVARELNTTYKAVVSSSTAGETSLLPDPAAIDTAIKSGFLKLDHEICHGPIPTLKKVSKSEAAAALSPALAGSCGLLSFYDSRSKIFRTACTGDSRAVLGRRNPQTGKWFAKPLSEDQTGSNPNEEARMRSEHPGEPYVIRNGRVLGQLEPTRAFGDAVYKWTRDIQDTIKKQFFGKSPSPLLKTPPYVTAEPTVTSIQIEPANGDFVVLATDGLWEMLTNEEVVGLVGQWIDAQDQKGNAASSTSAWLTSWFRKLGSRSTSSFSSSNPLPVEKGGNSAKSGLVGGNGDGDGSDTTPPIRQQQWNLNPAESASKRWTVEDKNAATHLIRNALGGRERDMVCALLTLPSPYSRRYRDDLTVEVIFFGEKKGERDGEREGGGRVVVNEEATHSGSSSSSRGNGEGEGPIRAKL